jgi:hypothetical protein
VSSDETCAVCGRTILAGERVLGYHSADGRRSVCELCPARAARLGWRWEEEADPAPVAAPKRRGVGLGGIFRRRRRQPTAPPAPKPGEPEDAPEEPPAPNPDPAAPGARIQRLPPQPSLLSPFERAVARFNGSDAGRTVAGLVRTLGSPWVSVGALAGSPSEIRITVAWELSWYQWAVDLSDELRPVFQLDKGMEMDQLDSAARQWNASAVEGGRIVLVAPAQGTAADGEPVGR